MSFEICEGNITYDIVKVVGCILFTYLCEVEKIALLSCLITEVDAEGMLGGVLRKY